MTIVIGENLQKTIGISVRTRLFVPQSNLVSGYIDPLKSIGEWTFEMHNSTDDEKWSSIEESISENMELAERRSRVWVVSVGGALLVAVIGALLITWKCIRKYKKDADVQANLRQDIEMAVRKINSE